MIRDSEERGMTVLLRKGTLAPCLGSFASIALFTGVYWLRGDDFDLTIFCV